MAFSWQERMEALNDELINKSEDYEEYFKNSYQKAINSIQKDINGFYARFAKENEITYADAKKKLSGKERAAFRMEIDEYIEQAQKNNLDEEWQKTLSNASSAARIDRLEALQLQMRQQIELMEQSKNEGISKLLGSVYEEGYYKNVFELQKAMGGGRAFSILDTRKIEKVLARPWNSDGWTYSDRIWNDKTKLINQLQTTFTQGLIRGDSPDKIIGRIVKTMNSSYSAAKTLVLTEGAAFASAAREDSYRELGIEKFEVVASLDERTCDTCGDYDGKVFEQKEYAVGVTAPPYHPNCRCTTVPYFNDEFTKGETRTARNDEGKTYDVPADMTYEEWKEKYVGSRDESDSKLSVKSVAKGITASVTGKSGKLMKEFTDSLNNVKNNDVKNILMKAAEQTPVNTSFKKNSFHRNGEIYLSPNATLSTVAHELFHNIDYRYGISKSGYLTQAIKSDFQRLQNIAEGYGNSIENLLYSKYKNAFVKGNKILILKEEYRGISDILNGMSGGKINLGYRHPNEYWKKDLNLEKETWSQFGRTLYNENEEAVDMLKYICPKTYNKIIDKIKELN